MGEVHILDENENEIPPYTDGTVYFGGDRLLSYFKDEEKTAQSRSRQGWTTLGDIGHVDDDDYLYLTDRKAFMIISGGVNIYPQEVENRLITHAKVLDVAVFGVPHEDLGEAVKAVVQLVYNGLETATLEAELLAFCRERLSAVKCPKSIDIVESLPREDNGKLYKRLLRDKYWGVSASRIV